MSNKFDFDTAEKLCDTILKVSDTMESESERVKDAFKQLNDTFKDQAYNEFQSEFNAADRTMATIIEELRELHKALCEYKIKLMEEA